MPGSRDDIARAMLGAQGNPFQGWGGVNELAYAMQAPAATADSASSGAGRAVDITQGLQSSGQIQPQNFDVESMPLSTNIEDRRGEPPFVPRETGRGGQLFFDDGGQNTDTFLGGRPGGFNEAFDSLPPLMSPDRADRGTTFLGGRSGGFGDAFNPPPTFNDRFPADDTFPRFPAERFPAPDEQLPTRVPDFQNPVFEQPQEQVRTRDEPSPLDPVPLPRNDPRPDQGADVRPFDENLPPAPTQGVGRSGLVTQPQQPFFPSLIDTFQLPDRIGYNNFGLGAGLTSFPQGSQSAADSGRDPAMRRAIEAERRQRTGRT
jgi:hypothetical protein